LAEKIGVDVEGLTNQVTEYNTYCTNQDDPQFDRASESLKALSESGPL